MQAQQFKVTMFGEKAKVPKNASVHAKNDLLQLKNARNGEINSKQSINHGGENT